MTDKSFFFPDVLRMNVLKVRYEVLVKIMFSFPGANSAGKAMKVYLLNVHIFSFEGRE